MLTSLSSTKGSATTRGAADNHGMSDPAWPITDELRRAINERLARPRMTHVLVAKYAGVTRSAISQITTGLIKSSTALPAICEFLGINFADYLPLDEVQRRLLRTLREVRDADGDELQLVMYAELCARGLVAEGKLRRMQRTDSEIGRPFPGDKREPPSEQTPPDEPEPPRRPPGRRTSRGREVS